MGVFLFLFSLLHPISSFIYLSIYIYLPTHLPTYLSIYGSTALVDLGHFCSFLIYVQTVGLPGRGISP
jgi:hypothetical protein